MNRSSCRSHREVLSVRQVAIRNGVAVCAVHFHESKGLIGNWRNPGNQRRHTRDVLRRIAIIKVAKRAGIPLALIRETVAALPEERTRTARDRQQLSAKWADDLDACVRRLARLDDQLASCVGCGCLSLGTWPLRNPSASRAEQGPGPRLLEDVEECAETS